MNHVLPLIPLPNCCHLNIALRWCRKHCHWLDGKYATWQLPKGFDVADVTGDWSSDFTTIQSYWQDTAPPNHQCVCVCVIERLRAI